MPYLMYVPIVFALAAICIAFGIAVGQHLPRSKPKQFFDEPREPRPLDDDLDRLQSDVYLPRGGGYDFRR